MAHPLKFETIGEVATRLRLSPSGVYRFIRHGKFPKPVKLAGRRSGWPEADTEKYLKARIADRERSA